MGKAENWPLLLQKLMALLNDPFSSACKTHGGCRCQMLITALLTVFNVQLNGGLLTSKNECNANVLVLSTATSIERQRLVELMLTREIFHHLCNAGCSRLSGE